MHDPGTAFRALLQPGSPFVLANAWDVGSAKVLAALGAQALGTSSAGYAFTLGKPDGTLTRDEALAHAQSIVEATALPVSADLENGYGDDPETVAETVRMAGEIGLAGVSIEDTLLPGATAYDFDLAVERIRAAVAAARSLKRDFVLVARADGIMLHGYDIEEALRRLKAFEAAGADCLYAPLPESFEDLERIVSETVTPVNALATGSFASYTQEDFARIGVARISLGSSLARVTQRALIDAVEEIFDDGSFSRLKKSVPGELIDKMLGD